MRKKRNNTKKTKMQKYTNKKTHIHTGTQRKKKDDINMDKDI